ncbi:MAG: prolyl oligopeptidase family serine peptidase [Acidimicrobiaceae bacterium]|nr:prolyl oligopeptidase family serine peptidase [Acidimicrobiaceae bacterium]
MDAFVDADGVSVRWQAWNVPDMPWDRSRVQRVGVDGLVHDEPDLAGGAAASPAARRHTVCVRDDSGWLNVWVGEQPLIEEPFEHAGPSWGPGQQSFVVSPDNRQVAFTRNDGGFGRLCVVNRRRARARDRPRGARPARVGGQRLAAVRSGARTPTQVVVYDTATWQRTVVAVGPQHEWQVGDLVEPERVELPVPMAAHAVVSPAARRAGGRGARSSCGCTAARRISGRSRSCRAWPSGCRAGGASWCPTTVAPPATVARTSRRCVVGGASSTSPTRSPSPARRTLRAGHAARTVVFGSSAGGFTALGAVAIDPRRFAAAVLLYPVTDLTELAERSHRFERHYTSTLVGALPETLPLHRLRSPTFHADRFAGTPLLLLHGDDDLVVPVRQSPVFAHRVRAAGGDVQLHVYPGEGHGFRQVANQLDEYRRAEEFLARYVPLASRS